MNGYAFTFCVLKRCPQNTSAVRGVVQCGHFSDKRRRVSSNADVHTFQCKKIWNLFLIYGVSARTRGRGIEPVRHFADRGREWGLIIRVFCEGLLWMASFKNLMLLSIALTTTGSNYYIFIRKQKISRLYNWGGGSGDKIFFLVSVKYCTQPASL